MLSFWEKDLFAERFDCIVIGAGFTGLNAALECKRRRPKASILVVDDGAGYRGASTKNAGFACYGSPSELVGDIELMGEAKALELLSQRKKGIEAIARFCAGTNIYVASNAFEVFLQKNVGLWEKSLAAIDGLNKAVEKTTGLVGAYKPLAENQLPTAIGTIEIKGEGQVHPALLHDKLHGEAVSAGIRFCKARAKSYSNESGLGASVILDNGQVLKSEWLINCVNGFDTALTKRDVVAPARAQVLITTEIENLPYQGNYHIDEGYYYFRNVGKRLLLGGGRNLAFEEETTNEIALNSFIQEKLKEVLKFDLLSGHEFEIAQQWAGIMGMRSNKTPSVEQEGNCISVVGLSGMGVALSFFLPKLAVDRVF